MMDDGVTASWSLGVLLIASLALAVLSIVWWATTPRTPRERRAIVAQYEPPTGVAVISAAWLVNAVNRAPSAQLVDLAVRGVLSVTPPTEPTGAFGVRLLTLDTVTPPEHAILQAVFGSRPQAGESIRVSRTDGVLSRRLFAARRLEQQRLMTEGWWANTRTGRRVVLVLLQVVLLVTAIVQTTLASEAGQAPIATVMMLYISVLVIITIVCASLRNRVLTSTGVELRSHLKGLREFIRVAEADRIRVLQGPGTAQLVNGRYELYASLLGWAVLFNLEKKWATVLETERGDAATIVGTDVGTGFEVPVLIAFADAVSSDSSSGDGDSSGGDGDGGGGDGGGGGGD